MAYAYNENHHKKKISLFPTIFGAKEPRHSENIFAKKRYTSIVARVFQQKKSPPPQKRNPILARVYAARFRMPTL